MKVVVDIPNWLYNAIMERKEPIYSQSLGDAVRDGTPLPKGHGALIDISDIDVIELEDSTKIIRHEKGDEVDVYISAPIIVEADKRDYEMPKWLSVYNSMHGRMY